MYENDERPSIDYGSRRSSRRLAKGSVRSVPIKYKFIWIPLPQYGMQQQP